MMRRMTHRPLTAATLTLAALATTAHADPLLAVRVLEGGDYFIDDGAMAEGAFAFDTEDGRYRDVPDFLAGGDLLRTDADDKDDADTSLRLTVRAPATVYVLHADAAGLPGWIATDYQDTGEDLTLDTDDDTWTYSIYRRELAGTGEVELALFNNSTFDLDDDIMYGVVGVSGGSEPCRPDIDGDGELTLFDFLAYQNLFDAGSAEADFDGDGELTLFDFLAYQNAFDAGC
ncbi:MAG: GC-type dockerin domain-anchored protein [Phycisphaerales bacterium]